jgi:hypothetical protein
MPLTTISWLKEVTPPRIFFGASSEMYIGETKEAVPTAMPSTRRAPINSQGVCAAAEPRAPST